MHTECLAPLCHDAERDAKRRRQSKEPNSGDGIGRSNGSEARVPRSGPRLTSKRRVNGTETVFDSWASSALSRSLTSRIAWRVPLTDTTDSPFIGRPITCGIASCPTFPVPPSFTVINSDTTRPRYSMMT